MSELRTISKRDRDYIENRLIVPCAEAQEAAGRLEQCGFKSSALALDDAIARFQDECRAIRHGLFYPWRKP